jgi:hypothetical protein
LLGGSLGLILTIFIPVIFDIVIVYYFIVLVLALIEFIGVYVKVIIDSTGYVRIKAAFVIIGIMLPYLISFVQGNWLPNLAGYILSITGLILFYYGAVSE